MIVSTDRGENEREFDLDRHNKFMNNYSIATLVIFVVLGVLTTLEAPRIAANLPRPWIGVWERINIGAFLLWVVALAVTVWRNPAAAAERSGS